MTILCDGGSFFAFILSLFLFAWGISDCGASLVINSNFTVHHKEAYSKGYHRNCPLNLPFASDSFQSDNAILFREVIDSWHL